MSIVNLNITRDLIELEDGQLYYDRGENSIWIYEEESNILRDIFGLLGIIKSNDVQEYCKENNLKRVRQINIDIEL